MKKIIQTDLAPAPIGPYNQAVLAGNTLYISGQIPMDPVSQKLISGDIREETERVMQNLKAILQAANMSFDQVVKSTIFVKDMAQFTAINEAYGRHFNTATAPARETVEVANLPKYVNVEISMIATRD